MIRDKLGSAAYWDEWTAYSDSWADQALAEIDQPGDPSYKPQFIYNLARHYWEQILRRYSRGDNTAYLARYFPMILSCWEQAEQSGQSVWTENQQYTRHAWKVNLDHYIVCFWLVGIALALDVPDDQWQRLLALIGNEGEDKLLDLVISSRQPGRKIGAALCHPKPYRRLLAAIEAPAADQAKLLLEFLNHWHSELDRPAKKGNAPATAMYERPYWHRFGDNNFEGGAYFGRWCVEAVAAVKAFDLDDSLCLGHPNYPGDLLRPDGPSTHPPREDNQDSSTSKSSSQGGLLSKIFGKFKR
ncbi:PoNe immunity protein domain-containing protein [Amantichitinum ursilacus]|uniref:PoNi C-terminal domain-containing protein n=1 Tax=Amantichitinum ursilacus TaxID=857265 RepID=A0A0N0GNU3_9NEIS|nr:PoNe immunity protein domain-containing protein [Amantichitinum ursilacus]KPC53175.1 hypothetical protein WG78_08795 [Amantichitinum ursilacus]